MTTFTVRQQKDRIFHSVFPTSVSQPTPVLPSTSFGEPFGGPLGHPASLSAHPASPTSPQHRHRGHQKRYATSEALNSDQVRWDRAWHTVTSCIQLPSSVTVEDSFGTIPGSQEQKVLLGESLEIVLAPHVHASGASQTEDLFAWHAQQVRQHFVSHVVPMLAACAEQDTPRQVVSGSIRTLEAAHRQYLHGLSLITRGVDDVNVRSSLIDRFDQDVGAVVGNSWHPGLVNALRYVLQQRLQLVLNVDLETPPEDAVTTGEYQEGSSEADVARSEILSLVDSLIKIGLGGSKFRILFAEVMDQTMKYFIRSRYAWLEHGVKRQQQHRRRRRHGGDKASLAPPAAGTRALGEWVANHYGRLAVEVFSRVGINIAWSDVERWKEIAVGRLAALRIDELFDIVLQWPASRDYLDDLRAAVDSPERRLQLTDTFSAAMQKRLLHPGASTLHILQTYILMIRAFHVLDSSKVLLDRVVHALQLYLCQRDDAIRLVVTGLLANPANLAAEKAQGKLVELAVIFNDETAQQQRRTHADEDDSLDWDDMSWEPDPVDAGVNYKRPKSEDVIGTLISALGSQEIFIKEFQLIVSERLLSSQTTFPQERKVLGLLKKRFGEPALQNCDVMIKDVKDSEALDHLIRQDLQEYHETDAPPPGPHHQPDMSYHAKILSRLFWPSLPNDPYRLPPPVADMQTQYAIAFEQHKAFRKLHWLDQVGTAKVSLAFEDRTLEVDCKTYDAAVIYAFNTDDTGEEVVSSTPQPRTFDQLWQDVMLDEDLLEESLQFWVSQRVLRDVGNRTYIVIENLHELEEAGGETHADEAAQQQQQSDKLSKMDTVERERRTVYWQFVVGMLTNSGPAMPLAQIAMMMKMLISDGYPWTNEQLQAFLGEKVAEQELEFSGRKYRLPKR